MRETIKPSTSTAPKVDLNHLDQLWFQVAGTRCNLSCDHCFISCHPKNFSFGFLTLKEVKHRLKESVPLGVKEYYFTGGEPFLNPEMTAILLESLQYGPTTVLTNGTVLKQEWLERLQAAAEASPFSLEFRVSIDGFSAAQNDAIRGKGSFDRAMRGVGDLVRFGFLPIITAVRTWDPADDMEIINGFKKVLSDVGNKRPRLKILPTLQIGAESNRTQGYTPADRVTEAMMSDYDASLLICNHSRIVSDRGVHVCPILIEAPDALLSQTLDDSQMPFALQHGACLTCYQYGAICSNSPGKMLERKLPVLPTPAVSSAEDNSSTS